MSVKSLIISLLAPCICIFASYAGDLRTEIEFLAGKETEGRATGMIGNQKAAFYIISSFKGAGLGKMSGTYPHSFAIEGKGYAGHNIIGMLDTNPNAHPDKYVVVGAHFDGLGTLLDQIYPCADANASGTAVLLQMVKNFSRIIACGRRLNYNIIFVAFDGFHEDISGTKAFWKELQEGSLVDPVTGDAIRERQVKLMVDMCQLGGCEPPASPDLKDYIIILGEDSLPDEKKVLFHTARCMSGNSLTLYNDYYGSDRFTKAFYNMGDRKPFIKAGIPTLLFTSGITSRTYSRDDTAMSLDYPNLEKRCIFIFNFLFLYLHGN